MCIQNKKEPLSIEVRHKNQPDNHGQFIIAPIPIARQGTKYPLCPLVTLDTLANN